MGIKVGERTEIPAHIWLKYFELHMTRQPIKEALTLAYLEAPKLVTWDDEAEEVRDMIEKIDELLDLEMDILGLQEQTGREET